MERLLNRSDPSAVLCGVPSWWRSTFFWSLPLFWASGAGAQPLVPLGDVVDPPLLPTGISTADVHLDGQLVSVWTEAAGEHAIHVIGDFAMTVGGRRFRARQGVVWMTLLQFEGRRYRRFEVFLYREASIVDSGGTTNEGPLLFVTANSSSEVSISADRRAFASSADTEAYELGLALRDRVRLGKVGEGAEAAVPTGPAGAPEAAVPTAIHYSADQTTFLKLEDGQQVLACVGNVRVFRGAPGGRDLLEIQADAAVIFLKKTGEAETGEAGGIGSEKSVAGVAGSEDRGVGSEKPVASAAGSEPMGAMGDVEAAYVEGDIRMSMGDRHVRASRVYYDLLRDRAVILDAVVFAIIPKRELPIYVRAARVRQLSERKFTAENAILTTSEFHTPHYHVGAERVEVEDRSPRGLSGELGGMGQASYVAQGVSFNLYNTPVLYWPRSAGKVELSETALRGVRVGNDGDFGTAVETRWDLFNLLSVEPPVGFDAQLRLDYFSERGPAAGVDVKYERENYFGLYRGYVVEDGGDDNLGQFRDNDQDGGARGRTTWRHRHYLPEDWQLTLENSYLSDRGFLEEYYEGEFDEDKEQENLVYLKKQRDNWAFTVLGQARLNDFWTQTERAPDLGFHLVGEPLGSAGTWFSENRAGFVRRRAGEQELLLLLRRGSLGPSSGMTARGDTRQEVEFPFVMGPIKAVPFVAVRGTAWDDSPTSGGVQRALATYGVRATSYLSRVYPEIQSELFDVHGVRHVIKPEVVAWGSHANRGPEDFFAFDPSVEGIDEFDGVTVGVRQRWQTKRGAADRRRTVDWVTLDLEAGAFSDAPGTAVTNGYASVTRPETSVARNFVNGALQWRINDATVLLTEANYDLNDGTLDVAGVSLAVERTPRFSYLLGYRRIHETESDLAGFGINYKLDEKHTLALREEFDLNRGDTLDFTLGYIRKFPRWYVAVLFNLDEAEDDAGISLSLWPEGLPRAALGSKRFTGLATSTSIASE